MFMIPADVESSKKIRMPSGTPARAFFRYRRRNCGLPSAADIIASHSRDIVVRRVSRASGQMTPNFTTFEKPFPPFAGTFPLLAARFPWLATCFLTFAKVFPLSAPPFQPLAPSVPKREGHFLPTES